MPNYPAKRAPPYREYARIQWVIGPRFKVGPKTRDSGYYYEQASYGYLKEPKPKAKNLDTPEGFYHNESGVKSTLEERYLGHHGVFPEGSDTLSEGEENAC